MRRGGTPYRSLRPAKVLGKERGMADEWLLGGAKAALALPIRARGKRKEKGLSKVSTKCAIIRGSASF